jgi:hypothetical protein
MGYGDWLMVFVETLLLLAALFSVYVILLIGIWPYLTIHTTSALCVGKYKKKVIKKRWQNALRSTGMRLAFGAVFLGGFLAAILPDNFKIFGLLLIAFGFVYGSHEIW